ncbi:hypothetical protein [Actibacterium sp. 188UL27-1]|uniref:hypothetical protein n=1 Tax=Actibacterium sp. 188UL27-1 TaxID=2786961 RepID=UPI0019578B5D|nr:hypothetical protein [Actibacterium sp. 188UL27-1]MBM7070372.1 hypothetical protein [Actibacterium sp. 188UL27-1]
MRRLLPFAFLTLSSFAVNAQQVDYEGMQAGLSMLETNVDRILDANGFDEVDPTSLSLNTIVEIIGVASDDDRSGPVKQGIEAALTRWRPPTE